MYRQRIKNFQKYIKKENLDGFIISSFAVDSVRPYNIQYLCGFTGDAGMLIILPTRAYLLVDGRFHEQAERQSKAAKVIKCKSRPVSDLKDLKQFHGKNKRYGYEAEFTTIVQLKILNENLGDVIMIPTEGAVETLSIIKDKGEIINLKKAIEISDIAFERILGYLKPGLREVEIAAELEYQMKMLGSEKPAFDTIIASGYRSALPHGVASEKKIARGDFVTFDFGAIYKGYVSDMTRTIVIGKATKRQKTVYNTVLRAQKAAIKRVKSGVDGKKVDAAARGIIDKAGFGKYFNHGTGHGIGIYIHVRPSLSPRISDILKTGMVVTVEPGIYIPKWGGVRIEDDILVGRNGCKVLNKASKKLLEV
jgi:Xaa-Pro aminopeptidase